MPATTPEQICHLFKQYMAEGDIEALLTLYDPEAVFLNSSGETKHGRQGLRSELVPLASAKAVFDFSIKQTIQSGDIVLMHTQWTVSSPQPMSAVCDRGCTSPAGPDMVLAHWRPLYGWQAHGGLKRRSPRSQPGSKISSGCVSKYFSEKWNGSPAASACKTVTPARSTPLFC